jgi:hypothetical protein
MPTNLAIDDRLIAEARKLGHHRTKRETVTAVLDEYIRRRKQHAILSLFDSIDWLIRRHDRLRSHPKRRIWSPGSLPKLSGLG